MLKYFEDSALLAFFALIQRRLLEIRRETKHFETYFLDHNSEVYDYF